MFKVGRGLEERVEYYGFGGLVVLGKRIRDSLIFFVDVFMFSVSFFLGLF